MLPEAPCCCQGQEQPALIPTFSLSHVASAATAHVMTLASPLCKALHKTGQVPGATTALLNFLLFECTDKLTVETLPCSPVGVSLFLLIPPDGPAAVE